MLRQLVREALVEMPVARHERGDQMHGLRDRAKFNVPHELQRSVRIAGPLIADTKGDRDWVVLRNAAGDPVIRQSKASMGRVFAQGTNPDYEGRESYELQYIDDDGSWHTYDSQARRGVIGSSPVHSGPPRKPAWLRAAMKNNVS